MIPLHVRRTHPRPVPGCFGCKAATLRFNGSEQVREVDRREKTLVEDRRAYKDFRRQGIQPPHLKGTADLERTARSPLEVEHPQLMRLPDDARAHAAEAAQLAQEIPQAISRFKDSA